MNIEIYNYLNLINYKLAKLYKNGLYNPFSNDFVLTEEKIKERLIFGQIENKLPNFIFEEKKKIKKYFKNSQKNTKKLIKNLKKLNFSELFEQKFESYLKIRLKLTKIIIHEFGKSNFNESEALEEIFSLDPIYADLLSNIFDQDCDIEKLVENLENEYNLTYSQKLKIIEKKNNQKTRKSAKALNKPIKKTKEKTTSTVKTQSKTNTAKKIVEKSKKSTNIIKEI